MDVEKFTYFEMTMVKFNALELVPIVVGTTAMEMITGYDFGATVVPIALPDAVIADNDQLNQQLQAMGFNRIGAVDDPVFFDGHLSLALISYGELTELLGHAVPMDYIFEHRQPDYRVLTAYDLTRLFDTLATASARPTEMRQSDLQKVDMLRELGYLFDRLPLRQMNHMHPLAKLAFHFAVPSDYAAIDQLMIDNISDQQLRQASQKLIQQARQAHGMYPPTEIVAKLDGKLVGYALVTPTLLQAKNQDDEWLVGLLNPLVVATQYRGRGIGWRLQAEVEIAVVLSSPAVMLVTQTAPEYWPNFGYVPIEQTKVKASATFGQADLSLKELFPTVLETVDGQLYFPNEAD
ncbi:N-acetyltransferase [Weissella diestrammenae]|uniref:N-acetyltransferase n=1 Tax=Weissella diestrammenae TaxID=1162633 RepID=A0A7G9T729_9LACO|nr:GNAT family N-acetyltransferase [Weissella diestrammenae]MCM0582498.1 N-acetyltransferase [Weissella diestrammenae]QNN75904.1 N-acetyltransferase [Weissella diestrammenae]